MHESRITPPPVLADRLGLRPLNARSIVLSVLLGNHPPALPVDTLVRFAGLFDVRDGTLRTALSRMVSAGELVNDDGTYRLTGRMLERQVEQDSGLEVNAEEWDRTWWTAVVVADRRSMTDRRRFRSTMAGTGMGELRPDTWMRPANRPMPPGADDLVITRGPIAAGDEGALVGLLWDLEAVDQRARLLRDELETATEHLSASQPEAIASAFVASAACVQFLRTEPQLPEALVGVTPARQLREVYQDVNRTFRTELRTLLRNGPMP